MFERLEVQPILDPRDAVFSMSNFSLCPLPPKTFPVPVAPKGKSGVLY